MGTVLWREMLEAARRPGAWRLRWAGPVMLLAVFGWARLALRTPTMGGEGLALFGLMAKASILLAWLVLPWTTADAIAAERREGTLGLLWLTPLTATGVWMAKAVAHGIRAAWLLASMAPVMVLPVLLGGVGWADLARWGLAWTAMAGLSLTSGLVASAVATGWWSVRLAALAGNMASLGLLLASWELARGVGFSQMKAGLAAKGWWLAEVLRGNLPIAFPAAWRSVGHMAAVAAVMLACAGMASLAGARWMQRTRGTAARERRQGRGRHEQHLPWLILPASGLLLLAAWMDWPSPGIVRDLFPWCGWAGQFVAAVAGAAVVRDMAGSGMGEMVSVTPLGLGGWARRELECLESRLGLAWLLALLAQGTAMVAAVMDGDRWPWWLAPRLALECATATACGWAMLWVAAAAAWGRRPWTGIVAALAWGWVGMPLLGMVARIALDAQPWAYPGGWNEPWQSSRLAWQQPRVGSLAIAAVAQVTLMTLQGAWMRHRMSRPRQWGQWGQSRIIDNSCIAHG